MSAFVGGWTAANFSPAFTPESRATHGLMAWGLATLIVVGAAGLASSSSLATSLHGPDCDNHGLLSARIRASPANDRASTPEIADRAGPAQPRASDDRTFVALIVGAGAA